MSLTPLTPIDNLAEIIEEMFLVLTHKEKDVIVQRFSLDNQPKRTLENIGQQFSVTRERIRQIEKIALGKLKRTVKTTKLNRINEIADQVIEENGGIISEETIVSKILNQIASKEEVDANIIKLALSININLAKNEKTSTYKSFWRKSSIETKFINTILKQIGKILKKKKEVITEDKLIIQLRNTMLEDIAKHNDLTIRAILDIDTRLKKTDEGIGLVNWRHINPKSIIDKAYIVLKKEKKAMHFIEIANKIIEAKFDNKVVTIQAVHNELIRYEQFVLVGRGLYGLKELGYKKGTVSEIIEGLLEKKESLTKKEIIDGVLKQRHVKKGTISLNLQKNPKFTRIGRAVYTLDKSKS